MLLGGLQVLILIGFAFTKSSDDESYTKTDVLQNSITSNNLTTLEQKLINSQEYNMYVGVALMMLVGFGYLMTFLRFYGLGAVGLTMIISCLGAELALLIEPLIMHGLQTPVQITIMALMRANFAVAAILISFGGLIGKVSPRQLLVLVTVEVICYSFNKWLLTHQLKVVDCGGTIIIHMFGAYFGLAAAYMLGVPKNTEKEKPSTASDVFSLIGTAFLWLYWPSFVAGELPVGSNEMVLAQTQTVLALLGSTVATFACSPFFGKARLRPVDIQNATLAGGVAIGAIANLKITPVGALGVGTLAGLVSSLGFGHIQPVLLNRFGLHDTCGIHNLHGMPSVLGGFLSILCAGVLNMQPLIQLWSMLTTLGISLLMGTITGFVLKRWADGSVVMADDSAYWEVADDFEK